MIALMDRQLLVRIAAEKLIGLLNKHSGWEAVRQFWHAIGVS